MSTLAMLNLLLYAYVVSRSMWYFRDVCTPRRETDKVVIAGVGMLSVLFVVAQAWVLVSAPFIHTKLHSSLAVLYLFCLSNGVLYLSIISAFEGAQRERFKCHPPKRYFP